MRKIFIIEDNEKIVTLLEKYFIVNGDKVFYSLTGKNIQTVLNQELPDIILLDLMLPEKDGYQILSEIRSFSNIPIILLTAKADEESKLKGLEYGADDYVTKPFSYNELSLRIDAILRRVSDVNKKTKQIIKIDNLVVNLDSSKVYIDEEEINLSKKELDILWYLSLNSNKTITREVLLNKLWGYDYDGDIRTVDTHIKRLRAKLKVKDNFVWNIKTVFGIGYVFEVDYEKR